MTLAAARSQYRPAEELPRKLTLRFDQFVEAGRAVVRVSVDGCLLGDPLTDNAYEPDGYRFHDVMHLAFAAVLGWSPMLRHLLGCKRRSNPVVLEVEDGGRAKVLEESCCALAFAAAGSVPTAKVRDDTIATLRDITAGLEVSKVEASSWRNALQQGFRAWARLVANGGGDVAADLDAGTIAFSRRRRDVVG